jgi:hypothetical protein
MRVVYVRVVWSPDPPIPFTMPGIRHFDLAVSPEPGYPYGRKGLALLGAWRQLQTSQCLGMLVQDGDVVVDPLDVSVMLETAARFPEVVWTAPVRLWPRSTQRESWVWGHWDRTAGPSQQSCPEPTFFSFGFTYIPRRVIDQAATMGLDTWTFPGVDRKMSLAAAAARVPVRVADGCQPKHLHY